MTTSTAEATTPMRTARRAGLIEQVIEQLRVQITSGSWAVGARIPTESELAQMTGTSRNTVREAVQSLVHAGLLERRQGSGTYVLASSELACAVGRRVETAEHRDVLEVRRVLETGAARLAALRHDAADIAAMRDALEISIAAREEGDLDAYATHDVTLHRAIARATHNPVLIELYDNLLTPVRDNIRSNLADHPDSPDHQDLVAAIATRDPDAAAREAACFLNDLLADQA